jgi:hypothetical protein
MGLVDTDVLIDIQRVIRQRLHGSRGYPNFLMSPVVFVQRKALQSSSGIGNRKAVQTVDESQFH